MVSSHNVKKQLEKRKAERVQTNMKHIQVYNKMLDYIDNRFVTLGAQESLENEPPIVEKRNNPTKIQIHETER